MKRSTLVTLAALAAGALVGGSSLAASAASPNDTACTVASGSGSTWNSARLARYEACRFDKIDAAVAGLGSSPSPSPSPNASPTDTPNASPAPTVTPTTSSPSPTDEPTSASPTPTPALTLDNPSDAVKAKRLAAPADGAGDRTYTAAQLASQGLNTIEDALAVQITAEP